MTPGPADGEPCSAIDVFEALAELRGTPPQRTPLRIALGKALLDHRQQQIALFDVGSRLPLEHALRTTEPSRRLPDVPSQCEPEADPQDAARRAKTLPRFPINEMSAFQSSRGAGLAASRG